MILSASEDLLHEEQFLSSCSCRHRLESLPPVQRSSSGNFYVYISRLLIDFNIDFDLDKR